MGSQQLLPLGWRLAFSRMVVDVCVRGQNTSLSIASTKMAHPLSLLQILSWRNYRCITCLSNLKTGLTTLFNEFRRLLIWALVKWMYPLHSQPLSSCLANALETKEDWVRNMVMIMCSEVSIAGSVRLYIPKLAYLHINHPIWPPMYTN